MTSPYGLFTWPWKARRMTYIGFKTDKPNAEESIGP